MNNAEQKIQIAELMNKLFIYTDEKQWQQLIDEVFAEDVLFDMSSAGGGPLKTITAKEICDTWREGLKDLDAVHHQAGHYLIKINDDNSAVVFAYAIAIHYKRSATKGNTRAFIGSYDLNAVYTNNGWRLTSFKYNLKFIDGNVNLD